MQDDEVFVEVHRLNQPLMEEDDYVSPNRFRSPYAYRSIAGYACGVCCVLFFLLFFLIPRSPEFSSDFNTAVVSVPPNNFVMSQTYSVYNPNPYSLTISSVSTRLVTQATALVDNIVTAFPIIGLGSFPPGVSDVTVPASGWNDFAIYYNFNTTANSNKAIVLNVAQCRETESTFVTSGSFDMSTAVHDYDGVSLGSLITIVTCG